MFLKNLKHYTAISAFFFFPVIAFASSGSIVHEMTFNGKFGSAGNGNGQFNGAQNMLIDNNSLYVVDRSNDRIQVFDLNGNYQSQFSPGFRNSSIAKVDGGFLVAINGESKVVRLNDAYAYQNDFASSGSANGQVSGPNTVYIAPNGNIIVAEGASNRIQVFDSNGNYLTKFGSYGGNPGEFMNPLGISFDSTGNMYVVDNINSRIQIFNSSFAYIGELAPQPMGSPTLFGRPVGIYIDPYDNIFVVDGQRNNIQVLRPDGTIVYTYSNPGTGDGQLNGAQHSIVIGADGRLYISEDYEQRVQILNHVTTETFSASPIGGNETATSINANSVLTGTGNFSNSFVGYNKLAMNGVFWTLDGSSTFADSVDINTGLLALNGTLTSPDFTVASAASLGGTGTLVGDVVNNGTITPGNDGVIGTLSITGAYTNASSSVYTIDVNDAGNSDLIDITGTATLNGGTVNVVAANGNYTASTDYTILSASGGYTGTLGTVTSNLAFLTPTLNYVGNNVILNLVNTDATTPGGGLDFTPFASSGNEQAAAGALAAYTANGVGGDTEALNAMTVFNTSEAAQFLKQSTPNETTSLPQVQTSIVSQMVQPLQQRMDGFKNASMSGISSGDELTERNMWVEALGGFANQDSKGTNNGYRTSITGMRGGLDKEISNNTLVGFSVAYGVGTTSFDQGTDRAQSKYTHVDVYAQHKRNGVILEGIVGAGGGAIETTRFINAGSLNRVANGSTQAYDVTAIAKISQPIALKQNYSLIPSLTAQASWQRQNSFTETGAGGLNLSFNDTTTTPVILNPMLHVQKTFENKERGYKLTPTIGAGPSWQLTDRESSTIAGFSGGSPQFRVNGLKQDALALNIQAGVAMEPFGKAQYVPSVSINANSKISNTANAHSANVNLNWKW